MYNLFTSIGGSTLRWTNDSLEEVQKYADKHWSHSGCRICRFESGRSKLVSVRSVTGVWSKEENKPQALSVNSL
jgi:hypothetical protein